jgi:cytochrome c-type biogenesis protein CcmH
VKEVSNPEIRAEWIGSQLRCPVCRGVPIVDSPAVLAQEMMAVVRQQIAEGKTDDEIFRHFEERYGEWALLRPKAEGMNLAVWILPILFLLGGTGLILFRLKRRSA